MFRPPGNLARGLFHVVAALYKRAMSHPRAGLSTLAVHAGTPQGPNAPLTVPIVQSTTFRFESAAQVQEYARGSSGLFMYSRDENPTVRAAEEAVALLEGAESAVVFGSGMGAMRSEEHTSELQSQSNLVCRLLLEKKKTKTPYILLFV